MNSDASKQFPLETDEQTIRAELDRVLGLRRFSGAPQMSAFLRYIVTETLNGHADRIKAFSVGVDALGKPDTFDAQTDPSVRVLALRLRKTLAEVYEDLQGCAAVIDLRVGTYVPSFYRVAGAASSTDAQDAGDVATGVLATNGSESRVGARVAAISSVGSTAAHDSAYNALPPGAAAHAESTSLSAK